MKCLKVKEPWASLIVNGQKIWELRRQKTFIREKIAIGTNGKVIGYVTLCNCWFESLDILKTFDKFHHAKDVIECYAKGKTALSYSKPMDGLFVWFLIDAVKELNPYPYSFSTGSWCTAINHKEETRKDEP